LNVASGTCQWRERLKRCAYPRLSVSNNKIRLVQERARRFCQWLMGQPQQHIAVVSHSAFLYLLVRLFDEQPLAPSVRAHLEQGFRNGEMRAVVLTHTSRVPVHAQLPGKAPGRFVPSQGCDVEDALGAARMADDVVA
jgi:broad specificity phosphatase PhoE